MRRNLIQLAVVIVAVTSISCATMTGSIVGSSVASRNKAVRMIISSGDIDLINRKVAKYPRFREAFIGAAISLTLREGTPVQYKYAIEHYPEYASRLRNSFDMRIKRAQKVINRHCKTLLLFGQDFATEDGEKGKEAFLKVYNVPLLSEEVKTWLYIHDKLVPTFIVDGNLNSKRSVLLEVVKSAYYTYYSKPYFKIWVRREVVRYISQLNPEDFFKGKDSGNKVQEIDVTKDPNTDRDLLVAVMSALSDDSSRGGPSGSLVIKTIWAHFLNSLGNIENATHVGNFASWLKKSQILSLASKELGASKVANDISAKRPCKQCVTAAVLRHYASLISTGRPLLSLRALDKAHKKLPYVAEMLIRHGKNESYNKQCASIMIKRLRRIRSANALQRFLDGHSGSYHLFPSVVSAYKKARKRAVKSTLRQIKRTTRIRATAGTRVVAEKSYSRKCVRYGKRYVSGKVCIRGTMRFSSGRFANCNSRFRCSQDGWTVHATLASCSRWKNEYTSECRKYGKVAVYTKKAQDYVNVTFTIKNPTNVKLAVNFNFNWPYILMTVDLVPPTEIKLEPLEKRRYLHHKKNYRYSNTHKRIWLKRYRIVGVKLYFRGEK